MTDSDLAGRVDALEAQVAELKSVQDLLMRLLSTTRPLANCSSITAPPTRRSRRCMPARRAAGRNARAQATPADVQLFPDAAERDFPVIAGRSSLRPDAHRHDEGRPARVPGAARLHGRSWLAEVGLSGFSESSRSGTGPRRSLATERTGCLEPYGCTAIGPCDGCLQRRKVAARSSGDVQRHRAGRGVGPAAPQVEELRRTRGKTAGACAVDQFHGLASSNGTFRRGPSPVASHAPSLVGNRAW